MFNLTASNKCSSLFVCILNNMHFTTTMINICNCRLRSRFFYSTGDDEKFVTCESD